MKTNIQNKTKHLVLVALASLSLLSSCDLLAPGDVVNPNVEEDDFATSSDAMASWVNGTNACFGTCISRFAEITGLMSDDLYNNSSRSSKTYDVLDILYTDSEVSSLSTHIGKMIEMADFGLETVAKADADATTAQQFNLYYIKAIAYLLASENFVALPKEANGEVLTSLQLASQALSVLSEAEDYTSSDDDAALVALLKARAYRLLGDVTNSQTQAQQAISLSSQLLVQATFDDLNGFPNSLQEYISSNLFTLLPRLSLQAVKCPQSGLYDQPIAVAKIEEAHLIVAEANLAQNNLSEAQSQLEQLLNTVQTRNDSTVTTLTVTAADIAAATTQDALYTVLYTLRQETFFAEGRRSADLGIRLPLSEVEYAAHSNLPSSYTEAYIPAYLAAIQDSIDAHEDLNSLMLDAKTEILPYE